jgi:hypothetical protein
MQMADITGTSRNCSQIASIAIKIEEVPQLERMGKADASVSSSLGCCVTVDFILSTSTSAR